MMDKPESSVGWGASMHIWWGQLWRILAVDAVFAVVIFAASKGMPIVHKALFDLMNNYEGTTLIALLAFQLYLHLWAIRQSFADIYPTFSFDAESKKTRRSIFGFDKRLRWSDVILVWWAQAWRMLLIPAAIIAGSMASTFASHPGAANYVHLLNNNVTKLNLWASLVLSVWATKESLGDKYRTFRFKATPKTLYGDTP